MRAVYVWASSDSACVEGQQSVHSTCSCRELETSCFKAVTCFLHPTGVSTCNKQGLNWLRQRMVFC
jgi:hypothetical protein